MTLDEAIKHCLDIADGQDKCADISVSEHAKERIRECAADHRQLAAWLTELKDLREENKVLTSECDRLIKEKGELLNKVSGGDALRICQLEEQLQAELDNSHCLEIELAEAKRLLKAAVEDMTEMQFGEECKVCSKKLLPNECPIQKNVFCEFGKDFKWRYADEAERLLKGE